MRTLQLTSLNGFKSFKLNVTLQITAFSFSSRKQLQQKVTKALLKSGLQQSHKRDFFDKEQATNSTELSKH